VRFRLHVRGSVTLAALTLTLTAADHGPAWAQQKANEAPIQGRFSQLVPIEVPAFRGLEPRVALEYSSEGSSGFVGVGWALTGFSSVVRTKGGRGVPRFDATDVFILDGQELVACSAGSPSPGCAAGGSHATKDERYLRIKFEASTNSWKVWGRDGTLTVFTPVYTTASGTLRWGQTSTTDTHDNTTSYAWACVDGDCYPDLVTFGPYSVRLYRESRSDVSSFATGSGLGWCQRRSNSVPVR
jgi:hypothetical protein